MKKLDYSQARNKKLVQQVVFDEFKERGITKLVGLAGPNITDYLSFVKSKGIKQAEVYERDYVNLIYQMADFKPPIKTTVLYQDIYYAGVQDNVIYDLDFCCTIKNAEPHLRKFKKNAIVTLALRKIGLMPTLKKFCKIVSDLKPDIKLNIQVNSNYKVHLLDFGKYSYTVYQYHDTTPMCLIKPNF
jgi:hypothetical protein